MFTKGSPEEDPMAESIERLGEEGEVSFDLPQERVTAKVNLATTLLKLWQDILTGAENEGVQPITLTGATAILANNPRLRLRDLQKYNDLFYEILEGAKVFIDDLIEKHPVDLEHVEDDATWNRHHYLKIAAQWAVYLDMVADSWTLLDEWADAYMAAYQDAGSFLAGPDSLLAQVNHIGVEFSSEEFTAAKELAAAEMHLVEEE